MNSSVFEIIILIGKVVGSVVAVVGAFGAFYKFIMGKIEKTLNDKVQEIAHNEVEKVKLEENESIKRLSELVDTMSDKFIPNIEKTLCDTIREKIWRIHKECTKAGYISDHQWYIVLELYDDYHNRLHGNSFITDLVEDLKNLYGNNSKK